MKEGDVILASITQADGNLKNRPVLILRIMPKYKDYLVCGISTQLNQYIKDFDEIISVQDSDFVTSGLVSSSVIRLGFLALLPKRKILGLIGSISSTRHQTLLRNLSHYLLKNV
ncbi:type II toxin-antitoxin system PemK/MazF family toxin [Dactylococcopsis salina]|uniref:PemK-like protein n=1 Tax=Dactylococcopsis salina (strain PCC 8305) TaxID=13035 RepID=K9YYW0_DACS8|nr:PemK-like protein [Dactylococcopsis salina PCC 8305]